MKRWDGPSRWLGPAEHDIPSKTHRDSSQFEANREAGRAKNEGKRSGNTPDFLHFVQYLLYYSGFCLTDLPVHPAYLLIMLLTHHFFSGLEPSPCPRGRLLETTPLKLMTLAQRGRLLLEPWPSARQIRFFLTASSDFVRQAQAFLHSPWTIRRVPLTSFVNYGIKKLVRGATTILQGGCRDEQHFGKDRLLPEGVLV